MECTDPVRLGIALNYSVCLYEIKHDTDAAIKLASDAFKEAIDKLELLTETAYKDGKLFSLSLLLFN
jgi:hypothetical protein